MGSTGRAKYVLLSHKLGISHICRVNKFSTLKSLPDGRHFHARFGDRDSLFFLFLFLMWVRIQNRAVFTYGNVAGVHKVGGAALCIAIIQHHATSVIWNVATVFGS